MKQKGFTLIELMIVVAIIGILAVIAVPQYLTYTTKTKVAEGYYMALGMKPAINMFYQANKRLPKSAAEVLVLGCGNDEASSTCSGEYFTKLWVEVCPSTASEECVRIKGSSGTVEIGSLGVLGEAGVKDILGAYKIRDGRPAWNCNDWGANRKYQPDSCVYP